MKPYVTLNCAASLDGFIGREGVRMRFSNDLDKRRVHEMRAHSDGIMVGVNTVITDNPHLTVRHAAGKNPVRIIVDGMGRTPLKSNVLDGVAKTIIALSEKAPKARVELLRKKAELVVSGSSRVDLARLLEALYKKKIRKIMLEGGGTLNRSMLNENLVDEINIAVAPMLLGYGIRWINGTLDSEKKLVYAGCMLMDDQPVLKYRVK